jgi:putative endonuclease
MKDYYVYILSNKRNTVFYTGFTNNLERRMYEHKNKIVEGFTSKYNIDQLLFYEQTSEVNSAIAREKQIKDWRREKKLALIQKLNPSMVDLSRDFSTSSK